MKNDLLKQYATGPRWRGFNLWDKLSHKPDEWLSISPEWGMNNDPFRESDFEWIADFGFNFVRLPMSYKCWTDESNVYAIREDVLEEIDQAVEYGRQYGVHVAINFHRAPGYCIINPRFGPEHREALSLWDDEAALDACSFHWRLFAERYKGVPSHRLSFNLLNEPYGVDAEKHERVIRRLVQDIREVDSERLISIDGADFEPCPGLADLNVIQCARGYFPFELTHCMARWVNTDESWVDIPAWPMINQKGDRFDWTFLETRADRWAETEQLGSPIHVGEWGCYNRTSHEATLRWMKDSLEIWKRADWGWALWNFRGSFGILDSGRRDVAYENFNGHLLDRRMLELLQQY